MESNNDYETLLIGNYEEVKDVYQDELLRIVQYSREGEDAIWIYSRNHLP